MKKTLLLFACLATHIFPKNNDADSQWVLIPVKHHTISVNPQRLSLICMRNNETNEKTFYTIRLTAQHYWGLTIENGQLIISPHPSNQNDGTALLTDNTPLNRSIYLLMRPA